VAKALLERDIEVHALDQVLGEVAAGRGRLVVVEAAAGVGKTSLLYHARDVARATGLAVLSARGAELERDFTFGAVRQLYEPLLPDPGPERERLFTGAAGATEPLFSGEQVDDSLYHLLNGLYWLLVDLVASTPTVVLVDDAQWIDRPSLRFLGFLVRRLDSLGVAVIVAARSEERDNGLLDDLFLADDAVLLQPKGLSATAVAELVRRTLGPDAGTELCATCHSVTGGNPLYVRELLRILATADKPDVASVQAAGPDAVRRHLAARLRRLPTNVRRVARAVAVLGDDADLSLVARQSDLAVRDTATAAESLARHGIFERADPPAFVHGVVRDVVLSLIPLAELGAQHQRAATVLADAGQPVTRIASHLLRTPPEGNPDRIDVLLAAATAAKAQGSLDNAVVFLRRARDEPPPPGLRAEVNRLLGNCQAHLLDLDEAELHLRAALARATSPAQLSLCAYSLARFRNACGSPAEAVDLLAQAAKELPAEYADMAPELEAELIGIARNDIASRPLVRDRLAELSSGPRTAALDAQMSMEALLAGAPADEAVTLARRALVGDQLAPDRSGVWSAVHTLMVADCLEEADRRLNRSLRTAARRGLLFPVALTRGFLARCAFLRGDLALAAEHVAQGMAGIRYPNLALPVLHAIRVQLLVEEGRLPEAEDVLRGSVLSEGHEPQTGLELWLLDARMRLRTAQDRRHDVLTDAAACERIYQQWDSKRMLDVPWRLHAAWAYGRLGDRDRAAALVDEQLRLAESFGVPRQIGLALRSAAELAESRQLLRDAAELLRCGSARLELAGTLERLGMALLADGDRQEGRRVVGQAAELAMECRATAMAVRLSAVLTGNDGRAPRLSGVHSFTPAERQVADLAAAGLTNRQIAERLFLSEKTVEAHLSRAFRKIGVRSRTQLAVRVASAT
jgi:DNA-binding CsgD family transcriptional regulator